MRKKKGRRVLINELHFLKNCGMFTGVLTIHKCLTATFVIRQLHTVLSLSFCVCVSLSADSSLSIMLQINSVVRWNFKKVK